MARRANKERQRCEWHKWNKTEMTVLKDKKDWVEPMGAMVQKGNKEYRSNSRNSRTKQVILAQLMVAMVVTVLKDKKDWAAQMEPMAMMDLRDKKDWVAP